MAHLKRTPHPMIMKGSDMPADGKVNGKWLTDGDVILVQATNGHHIPAARATATGVIPGVVVANVTTPGTRYGRAGRRVTVRLYTLGDNDTLTLTDTVADVNVGSPQTFWYADHFRAWRDRGAPKSVDLSTV